MRLPILVFALLLPLAAAPSLAQPGPDQSDPSAADATNDQAPPDKSTPADATNDQAPPDKSTPADATNDQAPPDKSAPAQRNDALVIPWQAQIYSGNTNWDQEQLAVRDGWDLAHKCGGTLIAPQWVLTAAHCINAERVSNGHRVRLGASSISSNDGITYRIDRMVRHADYDQANHIYDIALVHFVADERTVQGHAGPVQPIELYDGPPLDPGVRLSASGWGKLEAKDKGYQADLSQVDLQTVDCTKYPKAARWAAEYHLCAAGLTPDDDTCEGDSGGPLVMDGDSPVLVGVVNFGFGCYQTDSPGVYLRIDHNHFRGWIARAMAADPAVTEVR